MQLQQDRFGNVANSINLIWHRQADEGAVHSQVDRSTLTPTCVSDEVVDVVRIEYVGLTMMMIVGIDLDTFVEIVGSEQKVLSPLSFAKRMCGATPNLCNSKTNVRLDLLSRV